MAHWGMPDPAEVEGNEEAKLRAFRNAFTVLSRRIDLLLALPADKLDRLRLERQVKEIGNA
jgi:arsenate reductase